MLSDVNKCCAHLLQGRRIKPADECLTCGDKDLEPLLVGYSTHDSSPFRRVAICRSCGHIQRFPLPSGLDYARINDDFFASRYAQNHEQHEANIKLKLARLVARIRPGIRTGQSILDIGAGQGWLLDYCRGQSCDYFAVEPVPELAASIELRGGTVIGRDLSEDYEAYEAAFDIIVVRHVLEHLLDPSSALRMVQQMLKPTGRAYVALPNAGAPSLKKGFRTAFIHATHISYFCAGNLRRLGASAGLEQVAGADFGELWALFKHGAGVLPTRDNYYAQQKAVFRRSERSARGKDVMSFAKSLARPVVRRIRNWARGWERPRAD